MNSGAGSRLEVPCTYRLYYMDQRSMLIKSVVDKWLGSDSDSVEAAVQRSESENGTADGQKT